MMMKARGDRSQSSLADLDTWVEIYLSEFLNTIVAEFLWAFHAIVMTLIGA
jgi:hypothetical protein